MIFSSTHEGNKVILESPLSNFHRTPPSRTFHGPTPTGTTGPKVIKNKENESLKQKRVRLHEKMQS